MQFVWAFLVGGLLCAVGQVLIDATRLTTGHTMVVYVVAGAVLAGLGLYEPLVRIAGAGASVPVSNFGFVLTKGITEELRRQGLWGALSGAFEIAGAAIAASILFGFIISLIFHPRG